MLKVAEPTLVPSVAKTRPKENPQATEKARMEAWLKERVSASQNEPVTEVVTLTPVLAALLLERNQGASDDSNRRFRDINLERIKRDIEGGRWEFNGQAIVVAKNGRLNDGQHRCRAVVETGRSIRTVMVFGPERKARMTLDVGAPRTVGDFLAMGGHHDTNALASVAICVWQWKNKGTLSTSGVDMPTKAETLMVVEHFRDLPESLNFVSRNGVGAICSKSILAFAHWAIWKKAGQHVANEFIDSLIEGTDLAKTNPILYCRNRLIDMRGSWRARSNKAELIFRSYNMWRRGDRAARIPLNGRLPELES